MTPNDCRAWRERAGWSVEQLAARAGLSPKTVLRFEAASHQPRPGTCIALAKALRPIRELSAA